jgi:hypothetical protein
VVTGTVQVSSGELAITGNPVVTKVASGRPVPAAITITPQQAATSNAADPLQGSLVRVQNVRVTAVSGTATSTAYNVTVRDQANGNEFIVRVGAAAAGIPQTFWQVGSSYEVRGTLGNFNGAQVKLRMPEDAVAAPAPAAPQSGATAVTNR